MYIFSEQIIDTASLSESACDGIARRIYKDTENHQSTFISRHNIVPGITPSQVMAGEINAVKGAFKSKKQATNHLLTMFSKCFFINIEESNQTGFGNNSLFGLGTYQNRLVSKTFIVNNKKPHASTFFETPILYSQHAVSRIIYRLKPRFFIYTLYCFSIYNAMIIEEFNQDIGDEIWLPVGEVGTTLLRRDSEHNSLFHVITFVDKEKLTEEQLGEMIYWSNKIKARESLIESIDHTLSQIGENEGAKEMNLAKAKYRDSKLPITIRNDFG